MSSPLAGRHWRIAQGGRRWSSTSLRISSSSMDEGLNISRHEATMDARAKHDRERKEIDLGGGGS
jgi:uncharacterized protein (UPF0303 family)